jgi:hypothetical protein
VAQRGMTADTGGGARAQLYARAQGDYVVREHWASWRIDLQQATFSKATWRELKTSDTTYLGAFDRVNRQWVFTPSAQSPESDMQDQGSPGSPDTPPSLQ